MNRAERRQKARAERRAVPHRPRAAKPLGPVAIAVLRVSIQKDLDELRTDANLHAYMGDDVDNILSKAGRMVYMVLFAVGKQKTIPNDHPDVRIIVGAGNALGDLNTTPASLEQQRGAVRSGLAAIDRLLPELSDWALAEGALRLDQLLASSEGMGTRDLRIALGTEK